jgi:pentose-5-phosphate-3-epimerase
VLYQYFGKSDEELIEGTRELTFKKVKRGFESTIDQLEGEKIKLEGSMLEYRVDIANGAANSIIILGSALVEMEDLKSLIAVLRAEQNAFVDDDGLKD